MLSLALGTGAILAWLTNSALKDWRNGSLIMALGKLGLAVGVLGLGLAIAGSPRG